MSVLIVGAGEMGRWFGAVAEAPVAFADVDRAAAERAADGVADASVASLDGEESYGTVCVAVPIDAATDAIERHAGRAERAVVDVTGVMVDPLAAMGRVAPDRERVSFHPLFGADSAPGTVAVSTGAGGPATDRLREQLRGAGNELVEVSAAEHDEAMRTVQGRAHAAVLAFGLAAGDVPDGLATPVYEQLTDLVGQVAGGTPRVYADIQETFGGAGDVAAAAERLADADAEGFERLYEQVSDDRPEA